MPSYWLGSQGLPLERRIARSAAPGFAAMKHLRERILLTLGTLGFEDDLPTKERVIVPTENQIPEPLAGRNLVSKKTAANNANNITLCDISAVMQIATSVSRYARGQEIYASGDLAERWYCMMSGLARKSIIMADGRRRIVDFLLPGDFFGFTACQQHVFTVEAVVPDTVIATYPRARIEAVLDNDPALARMIRGKAFEAISRLQARLLVLGRITAQEKVGAFLIEITDRLSRGTSQTVTLPMSRYDIADYLGLSVETVSRALTLLRQSGAIRFIGRHHLSIVDRAAFEYED